MSADPRPPERIVDREAIERFRLQMLGELCQVCELRFGAHVHHVKFKSRGGDDVEENFLWVCVHCDADHGSLPNISRYGT